MREIKFRAWNIINRRWCGYDMKGFVLVDEENKEQQVFGYFPQRDGVILMQYTGLHDMNGKEIYEGDILEDKAYDNSRSVVEWTLDACEEYGCVGWSVHTGHYDTPRAEECEVIGNIYENPDLLPVQEEL